MVSLCAEPPPLRVRENGFPEQALPAALRLRLEGFFAQRTQRAAARPGLAVLVPGSLCADDPAHVRELGLALRLAAQLVPAYCPRVLSAADLSPLLDGAQPLSQDALGEALGGHAMALCVLDRALACAAAAHLPVRLVGSDPAAWRRDKLRLAFWDPRRAAPPLARLLPERLRGRRVWLHLDPFVPEPTALQRLRALREAGVDPEVVLPPPASDRLRAALTRETGRTVATAPPTQPPAGAVLCATDDFVLALLGGFAERVRLLPNGDLAPYRPSGAPLWAERAQHVLYHGEELDGLRLVELLLGLDEPPAPLGTVYRPLISVVVPVYDRSWEIDQLARSLFVQRYPHLEVVLVANGSPPATLEALGRARALLLRRRIKVQLLRYPEAFGCAAVPRDIGAFAARGEFLCFLDSDDALEPGFFDVFLHTPADENAIYHPHRIFCDGGRPMGPGFPFHRRLRGPGTVNHGLYELLRRRGNLFCNSGVIVSRKHFVRVGGIWHGLRYAEDYCLWLQVARAGARAIEHAGTVRIALHPGNHELVVGAPHWVEQARQLAEQELA
ncbi:MAG: glycosyltransferase family A protein [Myxococcales bacterium]|nr:glycosyltransferase family 2 protein [Myxococcota bacterium]MDW8284413.1 glycosyltransferase family A protein [Myxococcales bacterium]